MAAQREIAQPKKRAKNVVRDRQMTRERKEKNPDCRRAGFRERIQTPSVGHLGIVILEQLSVGSVTRRERGAAPLSLSLLSVPPFASFAFHFLLPFLVGPFLSLSSKCVSLTHFMQLLIRPEFVPACARVRVYVFGR